jgi:UDP-glucose 4-epimerase
VRAIVTGGAGFIGSHVADALVSSGEEVHVLDNLSSGRRENFGEGVELHVADIRDPGAVFDAVRPEVVFHLAAQADVGTSVAKPDFDADVNVVGTVRILEAARRHGAQIVFSSTGGAIYGECDGPAAEDTPRRPLSPYGIAKLACEEYLAGWNRLRGTRHVALRLANVYGPRQKPELEGGVVAIFLDRMARGVPSHIFGDGLQTRDFVHVTDVVRAMLLSVGRDGGLFNVGSGVETSIIELHAQCRAVSGSRREPEFAEARAGDVLRSVVDPSLAARELGWRAEIPLEDGLRLTWQLSTAAA